MLITPAGEPCGERTPVLRGGREVCAARFADDAGRGHAKVKKAAKRGRGSGNFA